MKLKTPIAKIPANVGPLTLKEPEQNQTGAVINYLMVSTIIAILCIAAIAAVIYFAWKRENETVTDPNADSAHNRGRSLVN